MSKGKFALGALIGGAIGAVAALLTAPKSGKETREDLKKKVSDIKSDTEKKAKDAKKQVETVAKDVKDKAEATANDVKAQAEELKKRTENAVEGAKAGFKKEVK